MQASLAALGLLSSISAWLAGGSFWWLVGGLLLGSVISFTLIVILPTNKQLLSPTLDGGQPKHSDYSHAGARCTPLEASSVFCHYCCFCIF